MQVTEPKGHAVQKSYNTRQVERAKQTGKGRGTKAGGGGGKKEASGGGGGRGGVQLWILIGEGRDCSGCAAVHGCCSRCWRCIGCCRFGWCCLR